MAKKPTAKQKKALEKIVEQKQKNHGKSPSIAKAMREAGYAEATAKNPKNLTESKSWEQMMDEYFPDDKLNKVLQEGLEANRVISAVVTGKEADGRSTDFIDVPDHAVRHKFLDTALKLKKKFPAEKHEVENTGEITVTFKRKNGV